MPELPEIETTIRELRKKVLGRTFVDVWSDFKKMVKRPENFEKFKKEILNRKIENLRRRGKNILFDLSNNKTLLIHQKLTGHLLFGKWQFKNGKWIPPRGPLSEKDNAYLHLLFTFDDGQMLALSDLRKFAKVELLSRENLKKELSSLGINPLGRDFTFEKFKEVLAKRKKGKIKQVLMDQTIIAGIGNIYSDETLWEARVNPFKEIKKLSERELKRIYQAMQKILKKAIEVKGESISDFRRISGKKGGFDPLRKVYRREGRPCPRCGTIIKKARIGGRSTHFCPKCQKL